MSVPVFLSVLFSICYNLMKEITLLCQNVRDFRFHLRLRFTFMMQPSKLMQIEPCVEENYICFTAYLLSGKRLSKDKIDIQLTFSTLLNNPCKRSGRSERRSRSSERGGGAEMRRVLNEER